MAEDHTGRDVREIQKALQKLLEDHNNYYECWRRSVWSAIIKDNTTGQKYAVDRWPFDQGTRRARGVTSRVPSKLGASIEEIMEVLKLCVVQGVQAAISAYRCWRKR